MDELLRDFLTETGESLNIVDVELVRFEQEPNNKAILDNIFRLVHTIKGTCGFIGLPRLEALTHAAESLMANFSEGRPVTGDAVSLVLASIDRVKSLLDHIERDQKEPEGNDRDLIGALERMADATSGDDQPELPRPLRPAPVSRAEVERALAALRAEEEKLKPPDEKLSPRDIEQFRTELARKLDRLVAEAKALPLGEAELPGDG